MRVFIAVLAFLILSAMAFVLVSPWPAVWLLRRGSDGPIDAPAGYGEKVLGVTVRKDITYPSKYGKNQFDLYLPETEADVPLILWVHGGAFVAGDKNGLEIWGSLLASEGYAVVPMNYEWAPEAAWPAQIIQIGECLDAVKQLSKEGEPIDMSRIFFAGDSAGAHMAAQAATVCINDGYKGQTGLSMPVEREALKGVLLYCGPYEPGGFSHIENKVMNFFMNKVGQSYVGAFRWQKDDKAPFLDIIPWITADCPPVYITDGNTGSFERQGRNLGKALRELGVAVTERYFEKSEGVVNHEYQMQLTTSQGLACYDDTLEFLELYSSRKDENNE